MISIKVQCVCGRKYSFEVEPVKGRMPQPVNCPVCGADGTAAANESIAQTLQAQKSPSPALSVNRSAAPVKKSKAALWIGTGAGGVVLAAVMAGFIWWNHPTPKSQSANTTNAVHASIRVSQETKPAVATPTPPRYGYKNQQFTFPPTEPVPAGAVDTLDYMLQEDGTNDSWVMLGPDDVNGSYVSADRDPDGTDTSTFILNKWENPRCFEVYKVTAHEIQIRYETQPPLPDKFWIRRSEEKGGGGEAPGAVWLKRIMVPGGPGFFSSSFLDLFLIDPKTGIGTLETDRSVQYARTYVSITWVTNGLGEKALFEGKPVIRRFDEWLQDGTGFESYDYAYRNGLVGWHFYVRVPTIHPMKGDTTGQIFYWDDVYVFVASKGSATQAPEIYQYDPVTKTKKNLLRVIHFTSHQTPQYGEQWYVITRDTGDDFDAWRKKPGQTAHDFTLPEWTAKPGATIADIPCLYTHMPARKGGVASHE